MTRINATVSAFGDWKWLDHIDSVDTQEQTLTARRRLRRDEWYFDHHFPEFPVLPGVLLLEAMAHTAGALQTLKFFRLERSVYNYVLTGIRDARFYRFARPGDELHMTAEIESSEREQLHAKVQATVDDSKVARVALTLHRVDAAALELDTTANASAHSKDPFAVRQYLSNILNPDLLRRYEFLDAGTTLSRGP